MFFDKFVKTTVSWWDSYLRNVADNKKKGTLIGSKDCEILFPNILLVTHVKGFLIAELIGARKEFEGLKVIIHKENSIYRYLSQFDDEEPIPLINLNSKCLGLRFLCLAQEVDFQELKKRFPFVELYSNKLVRARGKGSVVSFGNDFSSCCIENSVLVNRCNNTFRCKNILELLIVKRSTSKNELIELFEYTTKGNVAKGVHSVLMGREESLIVAGQLQNMYLFPHLRETTLGEFINSHPEVVKKAFKTTHFEYEPYLDWLEHDGTVEDKVINPDLLVKREDGFYDIYDLKTAVLTRSSIVKGGRKRRRFIDYVEEGVAQLANYREYFEYPKNRELAKKKYGIEVNEPKLVLIVGNWENTDITEIKEACRRYKDVNIIDYDTFTHLFIGADEIENKTIGTYTT